MRSSARVCSMAMRRSAADTSISRCLRCFPRSTKAARRSAASCHSPSASSVAVSPAGRGMPGSTRSNRFTTCFRCFRIACRCRCTSAALANRVAWCSSMRMNARARDRSSRSLRPPSIRRVCSSKRWRSLGRMRASALCKCFRSVRSRDRRWALPGERTGGGTGSPSSDASFTCISRTAPAALNSSLVRRTAPRGPTTSLSRKDRKRSKERTRFMRTRSR